MALTVKGSNKGALIESLDLLAQGLLPFVKRELNTQGAIYKMRGKDAQACLSAILDNWLIFSKVMGELEKHWVHELKTFRNRVAHGEDVGFDDVDSALDSIYRLLTTVGAKAEAAQAYEWRMKLLEQRFRDRAREKAKTAVQSAINSEGLPTNLKPWREVAMPHDDIQGGNYRLAEFAADLHQVVSNSATQEYQDPAAFFKRTYLTENLKKLLVDAIKRASGEPATPVYWLQTNFGGGKTHSLLSLYHLFSDAAPSELTGVPELIKQAGAERIPNVSRAVIVGNRTLPTAETSTKSDGVIIHTLWGELAYQLGGKAAYELVRASDEKGTSPGDSLRELLKQCSPCVVLVDEWVAYARDLGDKTDLPAGTFETQLTFLQTLTEVAKEVPGALVVVSLPESKTEHGGGYGERAHDAMTHVLKRVASPWRPSAHGESFDIVRRRMFSDINEKEARTVVNSFVQMYRTNKADYPSECSEQQYEKRLLECYPIHPELFDRLYSDWATLERFQHTRGVLRLMALVIQTLWSSDDRNLLILPSLVPLSNHSVQSELTGHLSDFEGSDTKWRSIVDNEVDGEGSLAFHTDAESKALGKYGACRRVARCVFLGTAPQSKLAAKGLDKRRIYLGCVQPGEGINSFDNALRRLADSSTHLYSDGTRYWYDTQPSVNRIAKDLIAQFDDERAVALINELLHKESRDIFPGIVAAPSSSNDIEDEMKTRLVLIGAQFPHAKGEDSPALDWAKSALEMRGSSPRRFKNTLVFLAADSKALEGLYESAKTVLAWKSILDDAGADGFNLDPLQSNQARTKLSTAKTDLTGRIHSSYVWLLVPDQVDSAKPYEWKDLRLQGEGGISQRAATRLKNDERLVEKLGGDVLRKQLDDLLWQDADHILIDQLKEYFATYLYLPRLLDEQVLIHAIKSGMSQLDWREQGFGFAQDYDLEAGSYSGVRCGGTADNFSIKGGLLVKPSVAERYGNATKPAPGTNGSNGASPGTAEATVAPKFTWFSGNVQLKPATMGMDSSKIMEEVVTHFLKTPGCKVTVRLHLEVSLPDELPESVLDTVRENCRSLKIDANFS